MTRPALRRLVGVALALLALSGHADPAVHIEASVTPRDAMVGQQIILTVEAARPIGGARGELSEPRVTGAKVSLLGAIEVETVTRDDIHYSVLRKRYAVVPSAAGPLRISRLTYRAAAVDAEQFTRGPRTAETAPAVKVASARDIEIHIRARPEMAGPWLPVTQLTLADQWSKPPHAVSVGDALTRTVTVSAAGVAAGALPVIGMPEHIAYVVHADQPTLHTDYRGDGMHSRRIQRFVLLITDSVVLPRISVDWYDVTTQAPQQSQIEPVTLAASGPPPVDISASRPTDTGVIARWHLGLAAIVSLVLVALICAWAVGVWRRRHLRGAVSQIRRACLREDAKAAAAALTHYSLIRWPVQKPHNLIEIGVRLDGAAADALANLDRYLYGQTGNWQGVTCWQQIAPRVNSIRNKAIGDRSIGNGRRAAHAHGTLNRLQPIRPAHESA